MDSPDLIGARGTRRRLAGTTRPGPGRPALAWPAAGLALVCALLAGGCASTGAASSASAASAVASGGRPLSEVSQSPALPSSTTPPGPVITAACPLLSARKVAATIHAGHVAVSHLAPVPKAFSCNYQAGARYIQLWISIVPATRTPQQAVSLAIRRYGGVLQAIPGLGDAASYTGPAGATAGPAVQTLVTARIEGHELRMITMVGFLSGNASRQLASLARSVLARV